MARITLGIKELRENLGRDDGIVPLSYLWTDYLRPLVPRVSLTKWTKANEKGRHSYQLDQGMDLLERGLCESHTKVPCESMIEPEESKVDTIMMMTMMVMMMMMIIIIITIITITFIERIPSRDQRLC